MSARPTVLFLNHSAKISGGELALLRIATALEVFEPRVCFFEEGPIISRFEEEGVPIDRSLTGQLDSEQRRSNLVSKQVARESVRWATAARALRQLIRETRPSLVVGNSSKANLLCSLSGIKHMAPTLLFIREPITSPNFHPLVQLMIRRVFALGSDLQIANSDLTAGTLRGVREVVRPPIDSKLYRTEFNPAETAHKIAGPGPRRALIIGSISRAKGQLMALKRLTPLLHSGTLKLRVVGRPIFGGDELELTELKKYIVDQFLDDKVEIADWADDPQSEISRSDLVIVPSTIAEGYSQVAAQAVLLQRPVVISSRCGILRDISASGSTFAFDWKIDSDFERAIETYLLTDGQTLCLHAAAAAQSLETLVADVTVVAEFERLALQVSGA